MAQVVFFASCSATRLLMKDRKCFAAETSSSSWSSKPMGDVAVTTPPNIQSVSHVKLTVTCESCGPDLVRSTCDRGVLVLRNMEDHQLALVQLHSERRLDVPRRADPPAHVEVGQQHHHHHGGALLGGGLQEQGAQRGEEVAAPAPPHGGHADGQEPWNTWTPSSAEGHSRATRGPLEGHHVGH
ncbi:hypothetical protein EYF80_057878 [Liparis tanakae]|uniref:Uncharacterized protein n=1 Tax=Liparis tanakae TaxID=230148 RepID=A0A4Z2ETJ6_9TELE|nr:hypothetical protein EYF80_057878 [Liparis tanakae]